jgi:hypothetical protein
MSRWTLLVWLVGVACSPDGSGRGQAAQRRRQQQHRLRASKLSRRHEADTLEMEKTHTDGSVQFARRHRTGLGLSCLAEGRNCRSATEVANDQSAQQAAGRAWTGEILALPNRRNTYTVP